MTEAVVRARFTEGQFLRAGDLTVEQTHREDTARRHLIGGHTWGVVTGLGLLPGRRTVTVTAGVAVDGHGRMLVVTAPVQVAVSHPNTSGLQMDQLTRLSIPAEFIRSLRVSYAGAAVFDIASDISIAENPTFGFTLAGAPGGELRVEAEDNRDRRFEGRWTLDAAG